MTYLPWITINWIVFVLCTHYNRTKHLCAMKTVTINSLVSSAWVIPFPQPPNNKGIFFSNVYAISGFGQALSLLCFSLAFHLELNRYLSAQCWDCCIYGLGLYWQLELKPCISINWGKMGRLLSIVFSHLEPVDPVMIGSLPRYTARHPTRGSIYLSALSYSLLTLLHSLCRSTKRGWFLFFLCGEPRCHACI